MPQNMGKADPVGEMGGKTTNYDALNAAWIGIHLISRTVHGFCTNNAAERSCDRTVRQLSLVSMPNAILAHVEDFILS